MGAYCDDLLTQKKARHVLGKTFRYASDDDVEEVIASAQDTALREAMPLNRVMKIIKRQSGMDV